MSRANTSRRTTRSALVTAHRWLSLCFAGFWLLQAVTGLLIVYHWEIGDAATSGMHQPTDFAALERSIAQIAPPGGPRTPTSLWVSAGLPDRYNLSLAGPADASVSLPLAGDGTVLQRADGGMPAAMDTLVLLHQRLLAGETGEWIVGISGILLASNLVLALFVAWPRGQQRSGQWQRAIRPVRRGPPAARSYSWHRAVGLWAALPAIVLILSGTLLRFEHGVGQAIGAEARSIEARPQGPGQAQIGLARAVAIAQTAIPGGRFTAADWPTAEDATWRLRLLEPGEMRRAYGTSMVYVDAATGTVRAAVPASGLPAAQSFMNGLFPVHTGEFDGGVGRVLVAALGLWLAAMIVLGVQLWWRRRPKPGSERP